NLSAGPKTVKIDRLFGGIIPANSQTPIFPFGPYVDFGWIVGGAGMQDNLQTLKNAGFNFINPDPTYTDLTSMDQLLHICEQLGIYVQVSFRYSYTNTTDVVSRVKRWASYNSVLTWYTTDEPDGQQWTSNQPTITVYNAVKAADPYHPVALVLNCQNTAGYYTGASDIFGTDMYPIGISTKGCDAVSGDCGCDLCTGSLTADLVSRTNKYRSDYAAQGVQSTPVWMGLQAFSDPPTWWARAPTPQEFAVMFWLTIVQGYKAISFWKYPYVPDNTLTAIHTTLAGQLASIAPTYILSATQLPTSHVTTQGNGSTTLFAGAWLSIEKSSLLTVVINGAAAPAPFVVTVTDAKAITVKGRDISSGGPVNIAKGVVTGQLPAYGIAVYAFVLGVSTAQPTPSKSANIAGAPVVGSSTATVETTTQPNGGGTRRVEWKGVVAAVMVMVAAFVNI
ncbi:hypothetical protein BC938DRAFT_474097, partial [Jimgerdemannia flammicorona]